MTLRRKGATTIPTAEPGAHALTTALLQEKALWLVEKSELVNSKHDHLLQYQSTLQDKDQEIERLREELRMLLEENERIKGKSQELAETLQELLDRDEEEEEEGKEEVAAAGGVDGEGPGGRGEDDRSEGGVELVDA
jgi:regulator of replication initiation timing